MGGDTRCPRVAGHGARAQMSQQKVRERHTGQLDGARAAAGLARVHVLFPSEGRPGPRRPMVYPTPSEGWASRKG